MRKKIIRSFLIVFLSSFLIVFAILYVVLFDSTLKEQTQVLNDSISIILSISQVEYGNVGDALAKKNIRLTVIEEDGDVCYDNYHSSIQENHLQREEIKEAIEHKEGSSIRHSKTLNKEYLYVANYDESNDRIIRLAMPFKGIEHSALVLLPPFFIAFLSAFVFVWILSKRMADSIVEPLQTISNTIRTAKVGEQDIVFEDYQYPELVEITEALQGMNEEIQLNMEKLEKERAIRQEFFTNASHELKTPLTSIRGYSELLRAHAIQDQKQIDHCLDRVLKESDHMTQLINDILTISKLESKDFVAPISTIHMKDLLDKVLESLQVQIDQMELSVDASSENVIVDANLDHMRAILFNLISNAIKYNKMGGHITVIIKQRLDNMIIKVSDTGIGISMEDQEKVFQRFYRVDKQRSKVVSGTGIGLSIVKHIVCFYEGTIRLNSTENVGTEFEISLPICKKDGYSS